MDRPTEPSPTSSSQAAVRAIATAGVDVERVLAALAASGFDCELLPEHDGQGPAVLVAAERADGAPALDVLLSAVGSLAGDVQTLVELETVERLASIGRFLVESGGALRLSEEAARLLDDALDVGEVCAQAAPETRDALRAWLSAEGEERSEVIELTLTGRDGEGRRLRFVDAGDRRARRGFVQAVAFLPRRPSPADDFDPRIDGERIERRIRAAVAAAVRHDRPLALLVVRIGSEGELEDGLRAGLQLALQRRFDRCLRTEDISGPSIELACDGRRPEEFLVAVEASAPAEALRVARRLRDAAREPLGIEGRTLRIDLSIGVALLGNDGSDLDALVDAARRAVLHEDAAGVRFASERIGAELARRLELEVELAEAIGAGQIVPFYQPKVDAVTERVVGVEALARWLHPERGLVGPGEFIPIAEENGLIAALGEAVLRQACADAVAWQRAGIPPLRVAVNLSPAQFGQPDLVERVAGILDETGLAPELLELELTESMLMDDAEAAVTILRRFARLGISLAIDDFGTGYSSLSYLRRLPIDALKIDRSFIDDVNVNPDDAAIATSIILLGRSLKLRVVAEGVETRKQLEFLRVMQCDEIQGFLYSPPVPSERAVELFRELGVDSHAPGA